MLVARVEWGNANGRKLELEIERLRKEVERCRGKAARGADEQQVEDGHKATRLKSHYLIQVDKVRIDYERRMREM
jgi:hypothetical protein